MIKKKYLIIGSNSFSGSHFINFLLKKNIKVIGVSRSIENPERFLSYKKNKKLKNFSFYQIDLNKSEHVKKLIYIIKNKNIDHIINFSAQGMVGESWKNPVDWYQTNVIAQINFFQELKDIKSIKKYVHFTTPEVYGHTKKLIEEESDFNPSTPYAVSRAACDMHLNVLHQNYNFPVIFTRTANVYGPFQKLYRIIPKTIFCCNNKKTLYLDGGGKSVRSFIYIEDVCKILFKIILNSKLGKTYHISTKNFISIKDLVFKIFNILKTKKKLIRLSSERPGKDNAYKLSIKKIEKELEIKNFIKLDYGLKKTIKWFLFYKKNFISSDLQYKHKK
jgi:dTDP-glucose 4,6-dehydratase